MNICSICSHETVSAIDATIEAGRSLRSVAATFGIGYESLKRHRKNHLPVAHVSQTAAVAGETEVEYFSRLVSDLKDMDTTRFTPGQRIAHLDAVRRAVVDLAKVSPPSRPQSVAFDEVDGLAELVTAIYDRLEHFVEARQALTPVYEAAMAGDVDGMKALAAEGIRPRAASSITLPLVVTAGGEATLVFALADEDSVRLSDIADEPVIVSIRRESTPRTRHELPLMPATLDPVHAVVTLFLDGAKTAALTPSISMAPNPTTTVCVGDVFVGGTDYYGPFSFTVRSPETFT